ncbi:thiamine-phosphate kinase [Anaeromyxobacter oryzae]|uniref:Thiamine-monophosphate kinase n=1 Tax=Anaeromyxobacter oryzae TaxID=2918170 RepID=A0ABM7WVD2_9BACT|nr:thiamine-phosphate kinase [Anaeromyxobacter oryzae]BDG03471.1 thiamine-monophosphate kinase [Anaeromyxobacter oryzae]
MARRPYRAAPKGGEFALIDRFTRALPQGGEGVVLGIGDDAAVLRAPAGEDLVATVDAVVEGVHFDARHAPADVGWKALAVNLSDLAAMGARPLWALVALGVPLGTPEARLAGVARGLAACARRHRIAVAGGNVSRAAELSLTVTVLGAVEPGRALTRSGAAAGDLVAVSGTFGEASLGLRPGAPPAFTRRQRRPAPRLALGRALAGIASAALDVSDGLVQDLGHLCAASGVGAIVDAVAVPVSGAYRRAVAGAPPEDALAPALTGGEDYELVVAIPPARLPEAEAAARATRTPLTVVGRLVRGRAVRVVGPDGRELPLPAGHDHLRAPPPSLTSRRGRLGSTRRRR